MTHKGICVIVYLSLTLSVLIYQWMYDFVSLSLSLFVTGPPLPLQSSSSSRNFFFDGMYQLPLGIRASIQGSSWWHQRMSPLPLLAAAAGGPATGDSNHSDSWRMLHAGTSIWSYSRRLLLPACLATLWPC